MQWSYQIKQQNSIKFPEFNIYDMPNFFKVVEEMGGLRRRSVVINSHDDMPNFLQLVFHFKEVPLESSTGPRAPDVSTLLHHRLEFN